MLGRSNDRKKYSAKTKIEAFFSLTVLIDNYGFPTL